MFKRPKYGNKVCYLGDIKFSSKKEMQRYLVLKEAQDKGVISGLELQPKFELIPKVTEQVVTHLKTKDKIEEKFVQHPIMYIGDFAYVKNGVKVVEDIKSSPKADAIDDKFLIKEKLFRWKFGFSIRRVYNANEAI